MLTDMDVKRAKPKAKAYRLNDGRGLFVWITPAGGKLFRWKFRHKGKEKIISYGKYPDKSLAPARDDHAEARKLHAQGLDPMALRKAEKASLKATAENSFQTVGRLWLDHWQDGKSLRHVDTTRRRTEANILTILDDRPIAEIEAPELVTMVKAIEARGEGNPAKRALEATGQIFRFAIANGHGSV